MNILKRSLILAGCVVALGIGTATVQAQERGNAGGAFDVTPIYQEILDAQRKFFPVMSDADWTVISPKLLRVVQLKLDNHTVEIQSLFAGTRIASMGGGTGPTSSFRHNMVIHGQLPKVPHVEEDALNDALARQAPKAEIDAAVAKVEAARKQRRDDLNSAQAELRKVLTPTQEAVLVARGTLD